MSWGGDFIHLLDLLDPSPASHPSPMIAITIVTRLPRGLIPSFASRAASPDYGYQDIYDPLNDGSYRDREPRSNTKHTQQPPPHLVSFFLLLVLHTNAPPISSIPISCSRQSSVSNDTRQTWKGWADQPPVRPQEYYGD